MLDSRLDANTIRSLQLMGDCRDIRSHQRLISRKSSGQKLQYACSASSNYEVIALLRPLLLLHCCPNCNYYDSMTLTTSYYYDHYVLMTATTTALRCCHDARSKKRRAGYFTAQS